MEHNFFWGIMAGAIVVLIAFLIPALLQSIKTAKAAEMFFKTSQESLYPLILKLTETVERSNRVASGIEESVHNVQRLAKAIGETGTILEDINAATRRTGMFVSVTSSALRAGIFAALGELAKGALKKN